MSEFIYNDTNIVSIGDNVRVIGRIQGNNNIVKIGGSSGKSELNITITGNNNLIFIDDKHIIKGLKIVIGSGIGANNCRIHIGKFFSIEPNCFFEVLNDLSNITIGSSCMFSRDIKIHYGEKPHLIFNKKNGDYIEADTGCLSFGNHVWCGEKVYITKNAKIGDDCIIAACSVVARSFEDERFVVIGGNPARVLKDNVEWVRNRQHLVNGSLYRKSIDYYDNNVSLHQSPK